MVYIRNMFIIFLACRCNVYPQSTRSAPITLGIQKVTGATARVVARTLIRECIFIYSDAARLVSFEIKLISTRYQKAKCLKNNIAFLDNSNIGRSHLNSRGLHLNKEGTSVLQTNILQFLNSYN